MKRRNDDAHADELQSADVQVMARICWAYFREGQTQEAIAQRLGWTRKRVNRLLNDARTSGLVQITINSPIGAYVELETKLAQTYGLRRAIVVPTPADTADVRPTVGAAAGQYVSEQLKEDASLGITWGGTINAAAQNVLRRQGMRNTVVLMCGGLAKSTRINPYDNAAIFARMLDATCYYMTAPMYAETAALRDALVNSEPVRSVLDMARRVDMALLSATDLSEQSKMLEYGVISRDTWQSLRDAGATGDICGHYLDADGRPVAHPIVPRTINPTLDDLRAIPERILAAGGLQKIAIIRSAIRAGLAHVLITDDATASALL
ncbi:transcriptional regulator [Burkholderia sp. WAC0059]|uniref:sugar-binding transcriptional regulator n=1 Tax=Burkholderia sp. WAC0059 TaxID=2066022 RepID=UPI000C7EDDA0|nr:sugar-binding transcriptional regulator [Burkholderia sp. WAC0059]PLZ02862.1 transcriptional regulator [Burkholderia sp. WAC0059]